jgi:hypothetical protein
MYLLLELDEHAASLSELNLEWTFWFWRHPNVGVQVDRKQVWMIYKFDCAVGEKKQNLRFQVHWLYHITTSETADN